MARKSGKLLFLGLVAAATAAGVYHYLSKKDQEIEEYDDFDDLDAFDENIDDLDSESNASEEEKKNYINLDTAKYVVNDVAEKAKDALSKASKKIQETINEVRENKAADDDDFSMEETVVDEEAADTESADAENDTEAEAAEDTAEEFFDDDEA